MINLLEELIANRGKKVFLELVNGRKIQGVLLDADQNHARVESDEGIGNIPVRKIYILWENPGRPLARAEVPVCRQFELRQSCCSFMIGYGLPCSFGFGYGQACPVAFGCSTFGFVQTCSPFIFWS